MSNVLATSSIVAKKALAVLTNNLAYGKAVNRRWESTQGENQARGYSPGTTFLIRKPARYTYRTGRIAAVQDTVNTTVPLTINQGGTDFAFNSVERTVGISESTLDETIGAAMAPVLNQIDLTIAQALSLGCGQTVSTASGALPATQAEALKLFTDAGTILSNQAASTARGRRTCIMTPGLNGASVQGLSGLFNASGSISDQYKSGYMVDALGFKMDMSQNTSGITQGTLATGSAVTAGQSGASITVAATTGTMVRGQAVTLPGVFAVNPQSRLSTGQLQQFVLTADVASGATVLPVSPAIVASGAFQNVTNTTAAGNFAIVGAASAVVKHSMAFDKDCITLACVPLILPTGLGVKSHQESHDGYSVRVTEYYDSVNDILGMRLDVLFGVAVTYPELGVRIQTTGG